METVIESHATDSGDYPFSTYAKFYEKIICDLIGGNIDDLII